MAGNTYEMTGIIKTLFETMTFSSGFTKREFVLTMDDDYPQDVKFACVKDRIALLDRVNPGDRVNVGFRIRSREYKERYYTDLEAFRIDSVDGDGSSISYDGLEPPFDDDDSPPF
jgi:single-strand DNA-binding protein